MKKLLLAAAAVVLLMQPAQAGDLGKHSEGLYIMGGVLGGLILGDALNNHHHHRRHYQPERVYVQPRQEVCGTRWTREWNPYFQEWERVPHTVCWWE